MSEQDVHIDVKRIMELLPHRYPFLLVDRVTRFVKGEMIEAYKNVTINEPFFQGHFPGLPVMPGVLIMEALAQTAGILVTSSIDEDMNDAVFMFTGMDKVRFRRPVVPGDKLVMSMSNVRNKMRLWTIEAAATVDGEIAAQAKLSAALVDKKDI